LAGLKTCFSLTKAEMGKSAICPGCSFKPAEEPVRGSAGAMLNSLDDELDRMLEEWSRTLVDNLADPTVQENVKLLKPKARKQVQEIINTGKLPEKITDDLVQVLQDVFSGLLKVVVTLDDLTGALTAGGVPCSVQELRKRFDDYVQELAKGKDLARIRVIIE